MPEAINFRRPRQVALVRRDESRFGDALAVFISGIGLSLSEIVLRDSTTETLASSINAAVDSSGGVIVALEGSVLQEDVGTAGSQRTAQPINDLLIAYGYLLGRLSENQLIVVKQRADPVMWPTTLGSVLELGNDKNSSARLVTSRGVSPGGRGPHRSDCACCARCTCLFS